MSNLQELIYKQLPQGVKTEIYNKKEEYPEYSEVVERLNNDILSSFKSKVKLTKKDITLMSILLSVYYHIKNNPPSKFIKKKSKRSKLDRNTSSVAWEDFMENNYPFYDELEDEVERWPKFMFLLVGVYKICYNEFYNLRQSHYVIETPKFNRKNMKFISYIYFVYKYLDANVTLNKLRDWGY